MAAKRSGFTLVEILVVIAILGTLIGLLLPAVQQAREAARLTQCQNNMKNVCLASQNFYSANNAFPVGVRRLPRERIITTTWAGLIAPFLEQRGIFVEYDGDKCICSPDNQAALLSQVSVFQCPTLPVGRTVEFPTGFDTEGEHEKNMILAVPGTIHPPGEIGGELLALLPATDVTTVIRSDQPLKGERNVQDGWSKTVIYVETLAPDAYVQGEYVPDKDVPGGSPFLPGTSFREDLSDFRTNVSPDGTQKSAFTMHIAGLPAGFADGHVEVLAFETEPIVYARYLSSDDGETVPEK